MKGTTSRKNISAVDQQEYSRLASDYAEENALREK
jgi:hypothetical protein